MALTTILEEITLDDFVDQGMGYLVNFVDTDILLVEGETYRVVWDGTDYSCVSFEMDGVVGVGNRVFVGEPDMGEPFIMYVMPGELAGTDVNTLVCAAWEGTSHTFAIYLEEESSIIVKDRNGNSVTYEGVEIIRVKSPDGEKDFIAGNPVETTVQPYFSNGDMEVLPDKGELFSKVTITTPPGLAPENIASGVTIAGIKGEMVGGSIESKPIRFYDPLGNVIYGYTRAQIQEMDELPPGPELSGCTFDKWTHTLDELKAITYFADVGPTYKSGSYPALVLIIETSSASQTVKIALQQVVGKMRTTINWGDGSSSTLYNSSSSASYSGPEHVYSTAGRYIVVITPDTESNIVRLGYNQTGYYYNILSGQFSQTKIPTGLMATSPEYCLISVLTPSLVSGAYYPSEIEYAFNHLRMKFCCIGHPKSYLNTNQFANCNSLAVIAGKHSSQIRTNTFYGNVSLKRIGVTNLVQNDSFRFCDSLTEVVYGSGNILDTNMNSKWMMLMTKETPPTVPTGATWGTYPIYVPDAAVEAYKAAAGWSSVAAYIFPASEYPDK